MTDYERQHIIDHEHLRLLRIAYFVDSGMTAFMALIGLLYLGIGVLFTAGLDNLPSDPDGPPPGFVGLMFAAIGGGIFVFGAVLIVLKLLTARALQTRSSRTLCLITAALTCLHVPYGTLVGIFTFIVLGRPSVRALFERQTSPWQAPAPSQSDQ
jgi:hypothetical protein